MARMHISLGNYLSPFDEGLSIYMAFRDFLG